MQMEYASSWHWGGALIFALVIIIPAWKIVSKAGYAGAWSLFAFVPVINVIMLWVFAFSNWPRNKGGT
ncbi:MAG TPA: hypothetical protein VMG60_07575 [Burkholderiaceae bacterium]|nr:hypothetical protein [Burkholderiaceae bacterium]